MNLLIIVDMQNDFIAGPLNTPEAQTARNNIVKLIKDWPDQNNTALFFTQDTHFETYLDTFEGKHLPIQHCIYGTSGWEIDSAIVDVFGKANFFNSKEELVENVFYKEAFGSVTLVEYLEYFEDAIESITFAGVCTDICVISNVLITKTVLPEIPIFVKADCCAGTSVEAHNAALMIMKSCQIEVI